MQTVIHSRAGRVTLWCVAALAIVCLMIAADPAWANKFETISGGVNGSIRIKREWLMKFFVVAGGVSLLASLLAVVVPHKNPLFLNYGTWKQSAIILLIIAIAFFTAAAII